MSNELAVLEGLNLPSYLQDGLDETTKALMGGGAGGIKRISIKGGVWRMMVNGKEVAKNEDRAMNLVVVAAAPKVSRTFYAGVYKEGEVLAPTCWSADGETPNEKSKEAQATRCVDCPQNAKGSGQGQSKACRFSQRLAVALGNDIGGDIFQLTLPAASVFGEGEAGKWPLQMYAKMIGSKGVPITAVVTEARFDTEAATPKLTFKPMRVLTAEEHELVIKQGQSDAAQKAITMTVAEVDGVKALENKSDEGFETVKKEAAPVVETPAESPEPVKRSAKKTEEAPTPKKDLASVLADWDDA